MATRISVAVMDEDDDDISRRRAMPAISALAHRIEAGAMVTPASVDRASNSHDLTVSAFRVDYPPRASATLHRWPAPGCVLVYVLSGTIQASVWHARAG